MIRIRQLALPAATVLAVVVIAGCGGSDTPSTTAAEGGGGPASASSAAQARMTPEAFQVVNNRPSLPNCKPGDLGDNGGDEETCQWFWNHLLAWQPLLDDQADTGPVLGPSTDSMIYAGFAGKFSATHHWGPDLPEGCDGTGNRLENGDYCKGRKPGLQFGKGTNVETRDRGSEVQSTVSWDVSAGGARFGTEHFTAYNNGGDDNGFQWAHCGSRSNSGKTSQEWVACSRANDERDGAYINTTSPYFEDFVSFGWVVEDYPILVGLTNRVPGTTVTLKQPDEGPDVQYTATGSSQGALEGSAKMAGARRNSASIWLAGYRKRVGDGKVTLAYDITSTDAQTAGLGGATVEISAEFAQRNKGEKNQPVAPTCVIKRATGEGSAKCDFSFVRGGVSEAGVLTATLLVSTTS